MIRPSSWGVLGLAFAAAVLTTAQPLSAAQPRVIDIVAHRFEFTPNLVTLKKGEPVTLRLTSQDVVHGFYQKALGLNSLIDPKKTTEVSITPREAGSYTVICHHFCGAGHGNMKMTIVVE